MHFVWVYYHRGAKKDEIRWSVRSVEANFKGDKKITIVGDKPPWFQGHHIPVKRVGGPASFKSFRDSLNKLVTAVNSPEVEDRFCWMMDDVYFVNACHDKDIATPRHMGRICERSAKRLKGNKWQRLKARTAREATGFPCWDYATHLPHVIEKDKFRHIMKAHDIPGTLWLWENIYGNTFYKNPQPYAPFLARVQKRPDYRRCDEIFRRAVVFNHVSGAWHEDVRAALFDRFPTKSPTESDEPAGIKKGFNRGGVLISPSIPKTEPPTVRAVVPYRETKDREPARRWVREYLDNRAASVHFSDHPDKLFNRSAAINAAVRLSNPGPSDVLAIADADCFVTGLRFQEGAQAAKETGRLVIPHDTVCRLTKEQSAEVLNDRCPAKGPNGRWYRDNRSRPCVSGLVFLRFDSWLLINGMDESFRGWGGEDNALKIAADNLLGPSIRLDGPLYHLWHERQEGRTRDSAQYRANRRRWLEYRNAAEAFIFEKTNEAGYLTQSPYKLGDRWTGSDFED